LPKQQILSKSIILEQKKRFPLLLENFYCYIQYSAFIVKQEAKLINQKEYNQQNKEMIKIYQHNYYLNHRFKNTKRYKLQNIQKVVIVPSIVIKD
jgi:hypothetical protein